MSRSIATAFREGLAAAHHEKTGSLPNSSQRSGYARIGAQVEKFFFQASTVRDLSRCRQILCANIPYICSQHGIDADWIRDGLDGLLLEFPNENLYLFYQEVLLHHETSPYPVAPSLWVRLF